MADDLTDGLAARLRQAAEVLSLRDETAAMGPAMRFIADNIDALTARVAALEADLESAYADLRSNRAERGRMIEARQQAQRDRESAVAERDAERARADMHADLGRRTAEALGIDGDRSGMPEVAAALRSDAERYRWLCATLGETQLPTLIERITNRYVADYKPSIDAAIDAGRGAEERTAVKESLTAQPAAPITACPHGVPHRWACETCDQPAKGGSDA